MEVCEGELIHLLGKVISMDGNKITMIPKHEDLKVVLFYGIILYDQSIFLLSLFSGGSRISHRGVWTL